MLQHTVVGIVPGIIGALKEAMEGITAVYNKIQVCTYTFNSIRIYGYLSTYTCVWLSSKPPASGNTFLCVCDRV